MSEIAYHGAMCKPILFNIQREHLPFAKIYVSVQRHLSIHCRRMSLCTRGTRSWPMRRTPPGRLVSVMKASFKASWSAPSTPQLGQGSPFPKLLQVQKHDFSKSCTWNLRWDDQRGSGDQHFPPNWRWGRQHPALLLLVWNGRKRSSSEFLVLWYTMVVKMPSLRTSNTKELQRSLCMGFLPVYHNISSS